MVLNKTLKSDKWIKKNNGQHIKIYLYLTIQNFTILHHDVYQYNHA